MGTFFYSFLLKSCIIQPPADIIMTPQIIEKYIILGKSINNIQLFFQKAHIPGCNCMPGCCHCCYIIKHMTLWLFHSSKIRHHLFRLHHHFSQKKNTRTHNLTDQSHHTHNRMYLGQITAGSIQFLPDIRNCINTDNINSFICKEKEIIHHFIEHPGIFVIQIPLIRIKRSHYIMADFRKPGEISRRSGRKYLWHCFLIERRNIGIVKEKVPAHILSLSLAGSFCPFMILRGMVHNKIHTHTDPLFMAGACQLFQILHGAQVLLYLAEICHCIATIRAAFHSLQEWHKMNIIYIIFFQIIQFAFNTFHISGKIINVKHHSQHVIFLIPLGIFFSFLIKFLQCFCTVLIESLHLVT